MDRALFRGTAPDTAEARYEFVDTALNSPVLEKPEDVASAVYRAVEKQQDEACVSARAWDAGGDGDREGGGVRG